MNSEQVFINQLNFQPTSIGKHNFMGHLLPCAIDFKTNHPPIHLQWIGILGMATESRHVISMGPLQTEPLSAATSSVWRTLCKCGPKAASCAVKVLCFFVLLRCHSCHKASCVPCKSSYRHSLNSFWSPYVYTYIYTLIYILFLYSDTFSNMFRWKLVTIHLPSTFQCGQGWSMVQSVFLMDIVDNDKV